MIEFMLRAGILIVVMGGAFAAVALTSRRNPGVAKMVLAPGLTLVSGPGCRLCEPAVQALRRAGARVEVTEDAELRDSLSVRALPTAFVVAADGEVIMRRSGRAVISDAAALAAAANLA
jgi:hypothetical protein